LVGLNAGCSTAIGGLASWSDNTLTLVAELALADTGEALRLEGQATARLDDLDAATALGNELASALMGHDIYERASFS
jgi:hydroxymethylbilane synthase